MSGVPGRDRQRGKRGRAVASDPRFPPLLALIIAAAVAAVVLAAVVTPLGRGPDEYRYANDITQFAAKGLKAQSVHPPLYSAIGAGVSRVFPARDAWWLALRLLGALFAAVTVYVTYLSAEEALPDRPLARWAPALLVALLPQYAFVAASVNSDALLIMLCSVFFWLCVRGMKRGLHLTTWLALGAVAVLGIAAKERFVIMLPLIAPVILVDLQRRAAARHARERRPRWVRAVVVGGSLVVGVPLVVVTVRQMPWGRIAGQLAPQAMARMLGPYFVPDLFMMFWGYFDWVALPMDTTAYALFLALSVLAALGLGVSWYRAARRDGLRSTVSWERAGVTYLAALALGLSFASIVLYQLSGLVSQGRYMFIALTPLALAFGAGIDALVPQRYGRLAFQVLAVTLVAVMFVQYAFVVMPYYY